MQRVETIFFIINYLNKYRILLKTTFVDRFYRFCLIEKYQPRKYKMEWIFNFFFLKEYADVMFVFLLAECCFFISFF
ncbi:MAG TPA: hypothetical protein DCL86_05900, partial [Bacteroidales bacterium]|nr:hypothetical protein [Bacteroidales bacterium]